MAMGEFNPVSGDPLADAMTWRERYQAGRTAVCLAPPSAGLGFIFFALYRVGFGNNRGPIQGAAGAVVFRCAALRVAFTSLDD